MDSDVDWEEKLNLNLKNTRYDDAKICIANCPDDNKFGSIILSAWRFDSIKDERYKFIQVAINKKETLEIIEALNKVIKEMD